MRVSLLQLRERKKNTCLQAAVTYRSVFVREWRWDAVGSVTLKSTIFYQRSVIKFVRGKGKNKSWLMHLFRSFFFFFNLNKFLLVCVKLQPARRCAINKSRSYFLKPYLRGNRRLRKIGKHNFNSSILVMVEFYREKKRKKFFLSQKWDYYSASLLICFWIFISSFCWFLNIRYSNWICSSL